MNYKEKSERDSAIYESDRSVKYVVDKGLSTTNEKLWSHIFADLLSKAGIQDTNAELLGKETLKCEDLCLEEVQARTKHLIKTSNLPVTFQEVLVEYTAHQNAIAQVVKGEGDGYLPVTLQQCKEVINEWLYIKDKDFIDVVFAFSVAEKVEGDPLWLFLIAPAGGGKTELLRAMEGHDYFHLSDLTSKTFISGYTIGTGKARRKIEDLLPQLDRKVLLLKDFTTILEKGRDERREIIAQLREIYDGLFSKKFGSLDRKVEYKTRFGLVAGVTPIIDKHWKIGQQLGERFLKFRIQGSAEEATLQAQRIEGKEKRMRQEIREAVMGFLSHLKPQQVVFPEEYAHPIIEAAHFLAVCRTPVVIQSNQSDFYYDFIPTPEVPTRLVKQLKKACKCLALVRGNQKVSRDEVEVVIRLALDTCPQDRLSILRAIEKCQHSTLQGCEFPPIKHAVRLPETSLRRVIKQLELLELVERTTVTTEKHNRRIEHVYFKLTEKSHALHPPTFLERTTKGGMGSASDNGGE